MGLRAGALLADVAAIRHDTEVAALDQTIRELITVVCRDLGRVPFESDVDVAYPKGLVDGAEWLGCGIAKQKDSWKRYSHAERRWR